MSDGYAADTVMRQPGYFRLQARALQGVLTIRQPNSARSTSSNHARAPERISLTWPGHTSSNQRVPVATVREQLQAEAESRAQHQGMPIEQTPEHQDLRTVANLADDQVRIKHQAVAHIHAARCTLWFGERGEKWDAIIKAHLRVFVLAGKAEPKVSALCNFDRGARPAARRCEGAR